MKSRFILSALLIFAALNTRASAELDFGGYYKNELVGLSNRKGNGILADVNKLRLRIDYKLADNAGIHLEPEYVSLIKSEEFAILDSPDIDRVVFDRAYLGMSLPFADVTAGRQRIAWGMAYLWNPTDAFNPFTLDFAVAEEERRGVDGVRVEVPLGPLSGLDIVALTSGDLTKTRKGIRTKTNIGMYDVSASYVASGEEGSQIGFDTSGELFGLGVKAEAAFAFPGDSDDYTRYVLGWNYTFDNGIGVDMEYYYNGQDKVLQDYMYFGLHRLPDELTVLRLSVLSNMDDSSFIVYPSYSRNIHENVDLSLESLLVGGDSGTEFNPSADEDPTGFAGASMVFIKLKFSF